MQSGRLALAVLLSASLSACVVGPDFSRPLVPQAAKQEFGEAGTPEFAKASLPDQWWRLFEDPVLDGLIVRALQHNTDVRQASANLRRARALVREARAGQFPALTARGAANTNRVGTGAMPDWALHRHNRRNSSFTSLHRTPPMNWTFSAASVDPSRLQGPMRWRQRRNWNLFGSA